MLDSALSRFEVVASRPPLLLKGYFHQYQREHSLLFVSQTMFLVCPSRRQLEIGSIVFPRALSKRPYRPHFLHSSL